MKKIIFCLFLIAGIISFSSFRESETSVQSNLKIDATSLVSCSPELQHVGTSYGGGYFGGGHNVRVRVRITSALADDWYCPDLIEGVDYHIAFYTDKHVYIDIEAYNVAAKYNTIGYTIFSVCANYSCADDLNQTGNVCTTVQTLVP